MRRSTARPAMLARHGAGSIAEHAFAVAEPGRRRLPSAPEAVAEQLGGVWLMIPHGDRRDGAQSRRVEHEEVALIKCQDHVVRVLILCDDLADLPSGILLARPRQDVGKRMSSRKGFCDSPEEL